MARKPELRLIDADSSPGRVYGRVIREAELTLFGQPLQLKLDVPDVRVRLADIIPVARDICDQVVAISAGHAESQGKTISCTKGCSACCGVYLPAMSRAGGLPSGRGHPATQPSPSRQDIAGVPRNRPGPRAVRAEGDDPGPLRRTRKNGRKCRTGKEMVVSRPQKLPDTAERCMFYVLGPPDGLP